MTINPLKISIKGDFWDCQIYRGRLYLWTFDGDLLVYDWEKFIDSLIQDDVERLALECAFNRGDYLYNSDMSLLFKDREIKKILKKKFKLISRNRYEYEGKDIREFLYGHQPNPFKELAIDTDIYNNKIYSITEEGLLSSTAHRSNKKYPVSSKFRKLWDCPLLSINVSSGGRIALSGGSEGLYEYDIHDRGRFNSNLFKRDNIAIQLSEKHSVFSNWSFSSIYSTSDVSESFMAAFCWEDSELDDIDLMFNFNRISSNGNSLSYKGNFSEQDIFKNAQHNRISWGSNEKLYRVNDNGLDVVDFTQKYLSDGEVSSPFSEVRRLEFQPWKGKIIAGGTANFGTIVQCEYALVVLLSDGSFYNIPGEVTRWRVYPRSHRYENHLHVIFEDRIDIYSFNNDYFVEQDKKDYGIRYSNNKNFKRSRTVVKVV